jgi:precorrin-6Y C5,15-methyltransferase (decarboxylating)
MKLNPCQIIGVLDNGIASLTPATLNALQQADLVIGATRVLALFAEQISQAECKDLTGHITQVPEWVKTGQEQHKKVVVLASGDPLCHGMGGFLLKKLDAKNLEIFPNLSSIQLAFAKAKLPWEDVKICSVHSKDTGEWYPGADQRHGLYPLLQAITQHSKLAILTSPENNPNRIARLLIMENLADDFNIAVMENLLQDDEKVCLDLSVAEISHLPFNGNNVVLLWRKQPPKLTSLFGFADEEFQQRKPEKGLITKREVRAVSLARMQLKSNSIVWDIGAGSGSVGIEAAKLCCDGHVYAIEKNKEDSEIALANAKQFGIHNYTLLNAKAPEGLEHWANPDAVFIGGSGGELANLISHCLQRLNPGGCLVMNFVTIENLATAVEALKTQNIGWDVTQLQASRSQPILQMHRLAAENPVWIVTAVKDL